MRDSPHPSRMPSLILGIVLLAIGLPLACLAAFLVYRGLLATTNMRVMGMIVGIPLAFAVFFLVVGLRALFVKGDARELMPLYAWRWLSGALVCLGIVLGVISHWASAVVPSVLGLVCLLREPKVAKWLKWANFLPG